MRPLASLIISVLGTALARCPVRSVQGLGRDDCFQLSHYVDNWDGAEGYWRSKGGHLASVGSSLTDAFLGDQCALWSAQSYWLGASEGSAYAWTWSDGTRFSYTNWAPGEPRNSTVLCLAAFTQNKTWCSQPCYTLKPYICEVPPVQDDKCPSSTTPISEDIVPSATTNLANCTATLRFWLDI